MLLCHIGHVAKQPPTIRLKWPITGDLCFCYVVTSNSYKTLWSLRSTKSTCGSLKQAFVMVRFFPPSGANIVVPHAFPHLCIFPSYTTIATITLQEFADICESLCWCYGCYSFYWEDDCYPLIDKFKKCSKKADRRKQWWTGQSQYFEAVPTWHVATFLGRRT